jgi:hypothetical protein
MRAPRAVARRLPAVDPSAEGDGAMSNGCPQAAQLARIANVLERWDRPTPGEGGKPGPSIVERFAAAADAVADLGAAQKKFCHLIVKHRMKILLGAVGAAGALSVISPTAAEGLKVVLRTWGPL